jgi:hypothetical protein
VVVVIQRFLLENYFSFGMLEDQDGHFLNVDLARSCSLTIDGGRGKGDETASPQTNFRKT